MTTFAYPLTGLVTCLAVIVMFWTGYKVGKARTQYQTPAPATTGPDPFMRAMRVQGNTVEQAVIYLPLLWLFAALAGDDWAAAFGVIWPIGRVIYGQAYYAEASKRGPGFGVTMLSTLLLLLGCLYLLLRGLAG